MSEDGEYITVHLLEPNTEGVKGTIAGGVRAVSLGHYGPCTALERSPFVPDVYLSVGDWSFNLWKDGVSTPLFVAPFAGVGPNARLTCGAWSPTRPGVLFIGLTLTLTPILTLTLTLVLTLTLTLSLTLTLTRRALHRTLRRRHRCVGPARSIARAEHELHRRGLGRPALELHRGERHTLQGGVPQHTSPRDTTQYTTRDTTQ